MPPFHKHSDPVAMVSILNGARPEKPTSDATRGYTEELWELTTSCWKEDPSDRPTVDHVLDTPMSAARQWESEDIDTPSPRDGRSSTPFTEGPESPTVSEHKNELATTASASPNYLG